MLTDFQELAPRSRRECLLSPLPVPAGSPEELPTMELEKIDLNEYLTDGRGDVFLIRVVGDSMETEIFAGDLLVVNRNLLPSVGEIVVARVGNGYTVKRYQPSRNGLRLCASNGNYEPRTITRRDDFDIFGVVTHVLHKCR